MMRRFQLLVLRATDVAMTFLERPWRGMKLNAEEVAKRRRNRLEPGGQNFLWSWQHRGFW